jgi:trk system potassium uptake protein
MHYKAVIKALSFYLYILLIPLLIPTLMAIWCDWVVGPSVYPQLPTALAFIETLLICFSSATLLYFLSKEPKGGLYRKEGLLLVILVYFITPLISALPFLFSKTLDNPIDAYFECVSGYTTTGATVLQGKEYNSFTGEEISVVKEYVIDKDYTYQYFGNVEPIKNHLGEVILTGIEAVHPSLLFWRSFMQCLGGGGIVVLFVAILPALGVGGKFLFQTEVSGPTTDSLFPRIKETASLLWKVYSSLIGLETILLMFTNSKVSLFDALCISFSTLSTGGFTPKNASIAAYASDVTTAIVMVFMILGSINFTLYFLLLKGKLSRWNDPELKVFLGIIAVSVLFGTLELWGKPVDQFTKTYFDKEVFSPFSAFLTAGFQLISAQTSTGFVIADFDQWSYPLQVWMLIMFFVGGMAGSTAGGIKIIRSMSVFKIMLNKIESLFKPDTVRNFRVGGQIIEPQMAITILCFFIVVFSLTIFSTFFLVLGGIDIETSITSVSCMLNNTGIAFRLAGPTNSFAFFNDPGKLLCSVLMIAGRLEFFALLVLFAPNFWKKT